MTVYETVEVLRRCEVQVISDFLCSKILYEAGGFSFVYLFNILEIWTAKI